MGLKHRREKNSQALSGLGRHLKLAAGFYSALHILLVLGFMALGRIHRMAHPAQDKAVAGLLDELTRQGFCHPETGAKMIYALV